MNPIQLHITALIEKYEARIQSISSTFYHYTFEADRAAGAASELEEVVEDLKRVRDSVDTQPNDK